MRVVALSGVVVAVLACGRVSFDPVAGPCDSSHATQATARPIALGDTIDGTLCPGGIDVYAVTLAAGDELAATVTPHGQGWLTIELSSADAVRAVETLDATSAMFADRDGTFYVSIAGLPTASGTSYELAVALRPGNHHYIAPNGDDAAPGTFAQPWHGFGAAIDRLVAGDVLVLKDGTYDGNNDALEINCTGGATSGTQAQPIRIAALTERAAEVVADGSHTTVRFDNGCSFWTIEGLHLENTTQAGSLNNSGPLEVVNASHIVVRRLLAAHNNQAVNSAVISIFNSSSVLVEECEAYDFNLDGIAVANGSDNTVRRNYAASRQHGGAGFSDFGTTNAVFENNIEEGNGEFAVDDGFGGDTVDTRILGNVVHGDSFGFISSLFDSTSNHNLRTQLVDHASIGSTIDGFYIRSNEQASCVRCTAIDSTAAGWHADELSNHPSVMASSSCTNCLAVHNGTTGFRIDQQRAGWSIASSNSFGNATDFSPSMVSELVNPTEIDPQLGGCLVYAPVGSPMRDTGAQIVFRYVDGASSDVPLWHPITGAFPCGAVVAGVNDDPTTSCTGVQQRLHVGTPDCALPYAPP